MTPKTDDMSGSRRISSIIALLSGLWLFVSQWVFNADSFGNAYSGWIVGALIAILAGFELSTPSMRGLLSWISCLLIIRLLQQGPTGSVWGWAGPRFPRRCVSFRPTSPRRKAASSI
jgi:hypothetical protein